MISSTRIRFWLSFSFINNFSKDPKSCKPCLKILLIFGIQKSLSIVIQFTTLNPISPYIFYSWEVLGGQILESWFLGVLMKPPSYLGKVKKLQFLTMFFKCFTRKKLGGGGPPPPPGWKRVNKSCCY